MKIYKKIYLITLLLIAGACTENFDDIAKNPNSPEEVIPSMLFTDISLDVVSPSYGKPLFYEPLVVRQVVWTEGIESYQYYYFNRSDFGGYETMRNVQKMEQQAERTEEEVYKGLAHFFYAWYFYDMTMTFGDIPYSEALQGETESEYLPAYDTQEEVFMGILSYLEQANQILSETDDELIGDVIYNGNVAQWRKAVNSFALKVLMSLSNRAGESSIDIAGTFKQIIENPSQYPIFASNSDNMQLEFSDKGGERYPFWNSSHAQYPHMDKFFTDILKEKQDKRLFYFAAPTGDALDAGLEANDFAAYEGADGTLEIGAIQQKEADKEISSVHPRYHKDFNSEPYIRLGYPEQQFNIAEAAQLGWISQDASQYYNEGIQASMDFYRTYAKSHEGVNISDDYIDQYINGPEVTYSPSKGLEQILAQKYIATFLNSGWTTYYNYRRTGLPELPINASTSMNESAKEMIPLRWKYPQKELNYNTQNVETAIKNQFGDDNVNAKMWLLK